MVEYCSSGEDVLREYSRSGKDLLRECVSSGEDVSVNTVIILRN